MFGWCHATLIVIRSGQTDAKEYYCKHNMRFMLCTYFWKAKRRQQRQNVIETQRHFFQLRTKINFNGNNNWKHLLKMKMKEIKNINKTKPNKLNSFDWQSRNSCHFMGMKKTVYFYSLFWIHLTLYVIKRTEMKKMAQKKNEKKLNRNHTSDSQPMSEG